MPWSKRSSTLPGNDLKPRIPQRLQVHRPRLRRTSPATTPGAPRAPAGPHAAPTPSCSSPRAAAELVPTHHRDRRVRTLVRRARGLGNDIRYRPVQTCELLLEHGLVVDVLDEGVVHPSAERLDDRIGHPLEPVLDVAAADRRLDQGRADGLRLDERRRIHRAERQAPRRQVGGQPELVRHECAALPRHHVRPHPGQLALGLVGKAAVQVMGDRQPQDAVAEELQPLVRLRPLCEPRRVREDGLPELSRKAVDQRTELARRPRRVSYGTRRSRPPALRSRSAVHPRRRS